MTFFMPSDDGRIKILLEHSEELIKNSDLILERMSSAVEATRAASKLMEELYPALRPVPPTSQEEN